MLWYSSGLQFRAEIRAISELGCACGISLGQADAPFLSYLLDTPPPTPLFIDSGAFRLREITGAKWRAKLDVYERFAKIYGESLSVVAPDVVGDQTKTLELWAQFGRRLRDLSRVCRVIVPLQVGGLSQNAMWERAQKMIDSRVVAGIPFKKSATSYEQYYSFLTGSEPARVHVLGVSPFGQRWHQITKINRHSPRTTYSADGCRVRALIGKRRALTLALNSRDHLPREVAMYEALKAVSVGLVPSETALPLFEGTNSGT
jgi:hypothetical protein